MLEMLKKQMRGILIATIFLIIPSFVLFYGARQTGRGPGRGAHAGEVYGRKIPWEEYNQYLQWAYIQARLRYGDRLESMMQFLNLEQDAWRSIVLFEAARRRGITVSDRELASFVTSMPMFLSDDGHFDRGLYSNIITYALGLRPEQFERYIRKSLAINRLQGKVTDGVRATASEAWNFYSRLNEEVNVEYVLFPAEDFADDIEITEETLEEHFGRNPESFRRPEARKIEYIVFEPAPGEYEASRDEIEAYYAGNKNRFRVGPDGGDGEPEYRPLEEVYGEIEKIIASGKAEAAARAKAEEALLDIEEGFVFWEDMEREETGFVTSRSDALPRSLLRRVFDAEPRTLSGPFNAGGKFYLFKVTGRNPSYVPAEYGEVRGLVEESAAAEESRRIAERKAREFLAALEEGGDFAGLAAESGREPVSPGHFTRRGRIPGIGSAPEFSARAFSLTENSPFAVSSLPGGAAVMKFIERKPASAEKFEEEKEMFIQYVESDKREKIFSDWFNLLLSESEARFFLEDENARRVF